MKLIRLNHLRSLLLGCVVTSVVGLTANAASILKLDDSLLLNDPAAWTGGTAPGSGDVAQWSGTYLTTNTWLLGAPTSWSGIQVLPVAGSVNIGADGNALTLGTSGIDLSLATNNLTISPNVILGISQTWNVTNSRTATVAGQVSDGGGNFGITKAGGGTVNLQNTNSFTGPVVINAGTFAVSTNSSSSGSLNSSVSVTVNNPAGGSGGTFGNFTVNAGAVVNGPVLVKTNSSGNGINCTVNGTIASNPTIEAGSLPAAPNANVYSPAAQPGTGFINVNGGGSLAAGGYITNNGQVKFSGTAPVTFGTFIMNNGQGGIWDANQSPKTFTFPNGSALAYFKCDSNQQATLQIAGNGSASIRWLGYNDANTATPQLWSYTNTFNGGTWTVGHIGQNNSTAHYVGVANITGGANMTVTNLGGSGTSPGATHGTWNIINGSLTFYAQLASAHAAGNAGLTVNVNNSGGGPGTLTITNGGFNIGFAAANSAPENNSLNVGPGGTANIKGTVQVGTSTIAPNAETNSINLSGGKLVVNGALQSIAVAGAQDHLFTWTGGQLSAASIITGAGFNDPASYITASTISNLSGIMAPGDSGVPGKTAITGGYVQTAGATLAVDIGGTSQGNAFTNLNTFYDLVSVSGNANVAGMITANLINGYTPAPNNAFAVLTNGGTLVASPSSLGYNGLVPVYTNGVLNSSKYFRVAVIGNNLILTNYGLNVGTLTARFNPTNAVGVAPTTPTFSDTSTGVITNRHWEFGDGNSLDTTSTSVPHTYSSIGTYTVTLTVYGPDGSTNMATGTVRATLSADAALWKGGLGGNIWDAVTANWFTNGVVGAYHDPDYVTFDDSGNAASPIALNSLVQPSSVSFSNFFNTYTISGGGSISGDAGVTLSGNSFGFGSVVILTTNNYTGATVVQNGTLQVGNGTADGGIDNSAAITNNGAIIFKQNSTHSLAATLAGTGSLTKSGSGTLILSSDNSASYSGPVRIDGGTLSVASDNTLGTAGGSLTISNAALQVNSGGTLNRTLTLNGTNDILNINGTVVLPNAISGSAAVTVSGAGTLQIDTGGTTVSLPTNVVLNGASIDYQRSDSYAQPGKVAGQSYASDVFNHGTTAGLTNTVTFADGVNQFGHVVNYASGSTMILKGSANSTNILGGADLSGGGGLGIGNGLNSQFIVAGGTFDITNSTLFGTIGGGFFPSSTFVVNGGTVISEWYGSSTAATDGGIHFLRCNLQIDSGLLWTKVWGAGLAPGFDATFAMNGGTFRLDDSGTLPGATAATTFFGLGLGNHAGAGVPDRFSGSITANQTGGSVILAASTNNNVELGCGNNSPTNHAATYTISGGSLSAVGGVNGGNVKLGGSADGASTALLTLTNAGKVVASGSIQGYSGASGSQAFTFNGGTLVAGGVNMTSLAAALGSPSGTLVQNGGTLSPGDQGVAGKTTVTGNYTAASTANLQVDINGASPASAFTNAGAFYDNVAVTGTTTLGGNLLVRTNGSFVPSATSSFTVLSAGSVAGSYANVTGSPLRVPVVGSTSTFDVIYTANSVILTNFSGASSAPSPTNIIFTALGGGQLRLDWPAGQGWTLQTQTNSRSTGLSTNWFNVTTTPPYTNAMSPANGTVFFRLKY